MKNKEITEQLNSAQEKLNAGLIDDCKTTLNRIILKLKESNKPIESDNLPCFSKESVIAILKKRDKDAFDNPYHRYEHNEINLAIEAIIRLMPPSYFPNHVKQDTA